MLYWTYYILLRRKALDSFLAWVKQLQFGTLIDGALVVVAAVLSITVHETCHGLAACWLGDPTAKRAGRLTLNPLKHIDWMGLVLLAIVKFGWARPVPVDMRNFRHPRRDMALTAIAGPLSNVLLALLALLLRSVLLFFYWKSGGNAVLDYAVSLTVYIAVISAGLAVFNLIPIPPLDGSKVLAVLLPPQAHRFLMRYERYGMILLLVLLLTNVIDGPLMFLRGGLLTGLQAISAFPFYGLMKLFS